VVKVDYIENFETKALDTFFDLVAGETRKTRVAYYLRLQPSRRK